MEKSQKSKCSSSWPPITIFTCIVNIQTLKHLYPHSHKHTVYQQYKQVKGPNNIIMHRARKLYLAGVSKVTYILQILKTIWAMDPTQPDLCTSGNFVTRLNSTRPDRTHPNPWTDSAHVQLWSVQPCSLILSELSNLRDLSQQKTICVSGVLKVGLKFILVRT